MVKQRGNITHQKRDPVITHGETSMSEYHWCEQEGAHFHVCSCPCDSCGQVRKEVRAREEKRRQQNAR